MTSLAKDQLAANDIRTQTLYFSVIFKATKQSMNYIAKIFSQFVFLDGKCGRCIYSPLLLTQKRELLMAIYRSEFISKCDQGDRDRIAQILSAPNRSKKEAGWRFLLL